MQTVRRHQCFVEYKEIAHLLLVGLQLAKCIFDACLRSGWVLRFDHRQWQAIDEAHQVGSTQPLATLYGELAHHQKMVALRVFKIHQLHAVSTAFAGNLHLHLHRHPAHQRFVKGAVALDQGGVLGLGKLVCYFVQHGGRCLMVEQSQCRTQLALQQHLAVISALWRVTVRGNVEAGAVIPAGVLKPLEGEVFEFGFRHAPPSRLDRMGAKVTGEQLGKQGIPSARQASVLPFALDGGFPKRPDRRIEFRHQSERRHQNLERRQSSSR